MADNAMYTPNPTTIDVVTYEDYAGSIWTRAGRKCDLQPDEQFICEETARVVGRGNLINDHQRWYEVELANRTRVMVVGEGS